MARRTRWMVAAALAVALGGCSTPNNFDGKWRDAKGATAVIDSSLVTFTDAQGVVQGSFELKRTDADTAIVNAGIAAAQLKLRSDGSLFYVSGSNSDTYTRVQ